MGGFVKQDHGKRNETKQNNIRVKYRSTVGENIIICLIYRTAAKGRRTF